MAPRRFALVGITAGLALGAAAGPVDAQRIYNMDPNAKRVLTVTFRGENKDLGMKAGEHLRDRLPQHINRKLLWPIAKEDIVVNLELSGYKYQDALTTSDARLLAQSMRADVFVEGTVSGTTGNLKVTPWVVQVKDQRMRQPLPASTGRRIDHVMDDVAKSFKAAWVQWEDEQLCEKLVFEKKFEEAAVAARRAIAAYPQSTMARVCLLSALEYSRASPDVLLPIANEVLALDSLNYHGLLFAANANKAKGNADASTALLLKLVTTEPNNVPLTTRLAEQLAESENFTGAIAMIDGAIAANPGDPDLIRLRFKILVYTKSWKEAINSGEELLRTDTSATDTTFFINLAAAYRADSQPQRAAEAIAKGTAKYPSYSRLHLIHSQHLRAAGQIEKSIIAARKALELDPNNPDATKGHLTIVQLFLDLGQVDSVPPQLRTAAAAAKTAADSSTVSLFVLQQGQRAFTAARSADSVGGQSVVARERFDESIRWFALADSIAPSDQAKFQQGYSATLIGQSLIVKEYSPGATAKTLTKEQACAIATQAQTYANLGNLKLTQGGRFNPQAAATLIGQAQQVAAFASTVVAQACKP